MYHGKRRILVGKPCLRAASIKKVSFWQCTVFFARKVDKKRVKSVGIFVTAFDRTTFNKRQMFPGNPLSRWPKAPVSFRAGSATGPLCMLAKRSGFCLFKTYCFPVICRVRPRLRTHLRCFFSSGSVRAQIFPAIGGCPSLPCVHF